MLQLRIAVCALAVLGAATSVGFAQTQAPPTASPKLGETTAGSGTSSPMAATERKALETLEGMGYTDIRNVRSGPEGISAKARKEGKQVSVVVDSSGHVREQ